MISLKEFGEKFPLLKDNIPFWEKYTDAKETLKNILAEAGESESVKNSDFFSDTDNKTPYLKLVGYHVDKEFSRVLMEKFAEKMELKITSYDFPEKLPLLKNLEISEDANGFVLSEVHGSICNFINSLLTPKEPSKWYEDYCPICGGKAGMGIIVADGRKELVCGHCHTTWYQVRTKCSLCNHLDDKKGMVFFSDDSVPAWFIEVCDICKGSIKIYDTRRGEPISASNPLFYLTTWGLDTAMAEKEYEPSLFAVYERAGWI